MICGLVLIWDWLENTRPGAAKRDKVDQYLPVAFVLMGAYLLRLCDSLTSILCLILGGTILTASRWPLLRQRVGTLGFLVVTAVLGFFTLDSIFNIKGILLNSMGRDESLTGRTDVWRELLALRTDPVFGTGFCSIWSDQSLLSRLPEWVAKSAHNGYLEVYIDGGYVGLFFLAVMLIAIGHRLNRFLKYGSNYALLRFAVFTTTLIASVSESHWGRMSSLGFVFLLTAIEPFQSESDEGLNEMEEFDQSLQEESVPLRASFT